MAEIFRPFVVAHRELVAWMAVSGFVVFYSAFSFWFVMGAWRDWMKTRMAYLEWKDKRKREASNG